MCSSAGVCSKASTPASTRKRITGRSQAPFIAESRSSSTMSTQSVTARSSGSTAMLSGPRTPQGESLCLRTLRVQGLAEVQFVASDAREHLEGAIARALVYPRDQRGMGFPDGRTQPLYERWAGVRVRQHPPVLASEADVEAGERFALSSRSFRTDATEGGSPARGARGRPHSLSWPSRLSTVASSVSSGMSVPDTKRLVVQRRSVFGQRVVSSPRLKSLWTLTGLPWWVSWLSMSSSDQL